MTKDLEKKLKKIESNFGERCHEMYRCYDEITCPFCGISHVKIKVNGHGYYRCRNCKREFFLCYADDKFMKD